MPKTNEEPIRVWLRNSNCEQVVERKLTYLWPDPRFSCRYDRQQTQLFVGALIRHGKTHPALLVNKRKIVAGLGHIEACRKLGASSFPAIDVELLSTHELQRWVTTIRNLAKREAWPRDILSIEFQVLAEMNLGFDLNFGGVELACTDPV